VGPRALDCDDPAPVFAHPLFWSSISSFFFKRQLVSASFPAPGLSSLFASGKQGRCWTLNRRAFFKFSPRSFFRFLFSSFYLPSFPWRLFMSLDWFAHMSFPPFLSALFLVPPLRTGRLAWRTCVIAKFML